jgi:hypothetical protein
MMMMMMRFYIHQGHNTEKVYPQHPQDLQALLPYMPILHSSVDYSGYLTSGNK